MQDLPPGNAVAISRANDPAGVQARSTPKTREYPGVSVAGGEWVVDGPQVSCPAAGAERVPAVPFESTDPGKPRLAAHGAAHPPCTHATAKRVWRPSWDALPHDRAVIAGVDVAPEPR